MKNIQINSINILDKAEMLVSDHQKALTAFKKQGIESEDIYLEHTGFVGDMVQDIKNHGGNDKAICCYNSDHFERWKSELGFDLEKGAFGENLTLSGVNAHESRVYIGDRYQLGEAVVEVSEPRGPCYMIGIRYNYKEFPIYLQTSGLTGFYLRTIKPGMVKKSDLLIHLSSHPDQISIMDVNHIRYHDFNNKEELDRLIKLSPLTEEWRIRFEKMRKKLK
jgi:MOSC domain-containing protein YiiM